MEQIVVSKLYGEEKKAKVGKLLIKAGDLIDIGTQLFSAESSKGTFDVESEYTGKICKLLIEEGQEVCIGDAIAEIEGSKAVAEPAKSTGYSFGISKPKKEEIACDIAVIGGGPGGYVAAIRAAQLGADVVLIEEHKVGGTCLNTGCIPTKSFVASAHLLDKIKHSFDFGLETGDVTVDLAKIVDRKNGVVQSLQAGIKYLFDHWNIRYIEGKAVVSEDTIKVNNQKIDASIAAKKIILATGSKPARLPISGSDLSVVMTNEEILDMQDLPASLTVIGGGVIGMEFAFIFNSLGCDVTVVEYMDSILATCDEDVVEVIIDECKDRGIKLYTGAKVESITLAENGDAIVGFEKEDEKRFLVSEKVLMSVGRRANLDSVDLGVLSVELNEKGNGIAVDEHMVTSNPDVYAIGDVTNIIQLAHVASHQGIVAAENCMGKDSVMHYNAVPSAIFVTPEMATVGLCEKAAKQAGIEYGVSTFPFCANGKALSQGEGKGFVKLLYLEEEKCLIGGAVVGPGATDLIAILGTHIQNKTDYRTMQHTIYAHPTTAESIHEALLGITGEAIHFA